MTLVERYVMAQPGPSDYRTADSTANPEGQSKGITDQATETARQLGSRAEGMTRELGAAIRERPYTTLAIAAGLAFAVGAVWKLGQRPPSRMERLLAQLPEVPDRHELAQWWRQARWR
jgi:hypothetical protein